MTPHEENSLGHEPNRVSVRGIAVAGFLTSGFLALVLLSMYSLLGPFNDGVQQQAEKTQAVMEAPAAPHLDPNLRQEMQALRAAEDQRLEGYGWVDEQQGVARIPIERAMEIIIQRGSSPTPEHKEAEE